MVTKCLIIETPSGRYAGLHAEFPQMAMHAGSAYVHGLKSATGDFVIIMDADLSHHVRLCTGQSHGCTAALLAASGPASLLACLRE